MGDERAVTKGEVLALRLPGEAGISAAQARFVDSQRVPVALIRRFDRVTGGGRIMYVSALTLLGAAARDAPGENTYGEIIDVLRQYGADAQADIEELWRRIAFSILITNADDHLRSHASLHAAHGQ